MDHHREMTGKMMDQPEFAIQPTEMTVDPASKTKKASTIETGMKHTFPDRKSLSSLGV